MSSKKDFTVGSKVIVLQGNQRGIVRFYGPTEFHKGKWVGVELYDASGKNDGSVAGVRYFDCPPNHGLFLKAAMLKFENPEEENDAAAVEDTADKKKELMDRMEKRQNDKTQALLLAAEKKTEEWAQKYEELQDQLENVTLDKEIAEESAELLKEELALVQAECEQLKQMSGSSSSSSSEQELHAKLSELRQTSHAEKLVLAQKLKALEASHAEEVAALQAACSDAQEGGELAELLSSKNLELEEQLEVLRGEMEDLSELAALNDELEEERQAEMSSMKESVLSMEGTIGTLQSNIAAAQKQLLEKDSQLNSMRERLKALEEKYQDLQTKLQDDQAKGEHTQAQAQRLASQTAFSTSLQQSRQRHLLQLHLAGTEGQRIGLQVAGTLWSACVPPHIRHKEGAFNRAILQLVSAQQEVHVLSEVLWRMSKVEFTVCKEWKRPLNHSMAQVALTQWESVQAASFEWQLLGMGLSRENASGWKDFVVERMGELQPVFECITSTMQWCEEKWDQQTMESPEWTHFTDLVILRLRRLRENLFPSLHAEVTTELRSIGCQAMWLFRRLSTTPIALLIQQEKEEPGSAASLFGDDVTLQQGVEESILQLESLANELLSSAQQTAALAAQGPSSDSAAAAVASSLRALQEQLQDLSHGLQKGPLPFADLDESTQLHTISLHLTAESLNRWSDWQRQLTALLSAWQSWRQEALSAYPITMVAEPVGSGRNSSSSITSSSSSFAVVATPEALEEALEEDEVAQPRESALSRRVPSWFQRSLQVSQTMAQMAESVSDLQDLTGDMAELHQLRRVVSELQAALRQSEDSRGTDEVRSNRLQARLGALEKELQEANAQVGQGTLELAQYREAIESMQSDRLRDTKQIEQLRSQMEQLRREAASASLNSQAGGGMTVHGQSRGVPTAGRRDGPPSMLAMLRWEYGRLAGESAAAKLTAELGGPIPSVQGYQPPRHSHTSRPDAPQREPEWLSAMDLKHWCRQTHELLHGMEIKMAQPTLENCYEEDLAQVQAALSAVRKFTHTPLPKSSTHDTKPQEGQLVGKLRVPDGRSQIEQLYLPSTSFASLHASLVK
jgi:hypothetical protein